MHSPTQSQRLLENRRIGILGKLAAMTRREATTVIEEHGGSLADRIDSGVDLIVIAGDDLPSDWPAQETLDESLVQSAVDGKLEILTETQFWQRLGLVEEEGELRRLYTPAMLAELLGVPLSVVRGWQRRGLIVPVRQLHRLPYFDFREVLTARRLAELLAAGVSPVAIERQLERWRRFLPHVARPLAQLSLIIEGKDLLLRTGDSLLEAGGQRRMDFDAPLKPVVHASFTRPASPAENSDTAPALLVELIGTAEQLELQGQLAAAAEAYRAALAAGGPQAELCFRLAEILYRLGDLSAARERYYATLEIDEEFVEARANLGCLLLELGDRDLAIAAFQGALACHADYADVHFQLAQALDDAQRHDEADQHWQAFLMLAPDSPWTETARRRLALPLARSRREPCS